MNTTITIKTDKKLRDAAKKTAKELGIPLTTVINAHLREFVREKTFSVSIYPRVKDAKMEELERLAKDTDNIITHESAEALLKHLRSL